jgi:hypothetical protein
MDGGLGAPADRQRTAKEKPYFIIRDEHKPVYAASSSSQMSHIDKERRGAFNMMGGSDEDEPFEMPGY